MSLTIKESDLLELRDKFSPSKKEAIDAAFSAACAALKTHGLRCATDDRAARLEAAIVLFALESNPSIR